MKSIIKKLLILLLIIPLTTTMSFSSTILKKTEKDTIVFITPTQLKQTNLIFAEHSKLIKENDLLKYQINNYKEDNNLLLKSDSIKSNQLLLYKEYNNSLNNSIIKKDKTLKFWKIGGITVCCSLLLLFLLK